MYERCENCKFWKIRPTGKHYDVIQYCDNEESQHYYDEPMDKDD